MKHLHSLAVFSLAYGGFLLLAYLTVAYFVLWQGTFSPFVSYGTSMTDTPFSELVSYKSILLLISGLSFMVIGYHLLQAEKYVENRQAKRFLTSNLLTDDEKAVHSEILKMGGQATQKELTLRLGLSRVKMHRLLLRLEQKGVLKTYQFGMTKKVVLVEDVEKSAQTL